MSEDLEILKTYVYPTFILFSMAIGLTWNSILLFIFIRHKEVRTPANTMILNLVVSDILNLGIGAPHHVLFHYPHSDPDNAQFCRFHTTLRIFIIWLSAMSVLALTIQRFFLSVKNAKLPTYFPLFYVLSVWVLSLLLSLPVSQEGVYQYMCGSDADNFPTTVVFTVYAFLFCLLLPTLMLLLKFLTAGKLRKSTNVNAQLHTAKERERMRSARVVTSLGAVFVVTYVPVWLWVFCTYNLHYDRHSTHMKVFEIISKWLLFTNSCSNPVALYISSGKFRKLFKRYLFCSRCPERKTESVECTMTSSAVHL